jgi:hypothetical protein
LRELEALPTTTGGVDFPLRIAVDSLGAATIAGYTFATDFPTTPNAIKATSSGPGTGLIRRLAPSSGVSSPGADFGTSTIGSAVDRTVTIANSGDEPLVVSGASLAGAAAADYAITSNGCGTVAPGASCAVGVRFTPSAAGARAAVLRVTSNALESPKDLALTGTGTAQAVVTPPPVVEEPPPLVLACAGLSLTILDLHREGRRVRVEGVALKRYAGRQATIRPSRGKGAAKATIAADGSFAATLPVPKKKDYKKVLYTAEVDGFKSPALHLYRNFTITSSKAGAKGLEVVAKVRGGRKDQKATLRRQVSCKETAPTSTLKLGKKGVLKITLPRPAAGSGFVFYRVITKVRGFKAYTLPIAVKGD